MNKTMMTGAPSSLLPGTSHIAAMILVIVTLMCSCGGVYTVHKGTHTSLPPQFSTEKDGYMAIVYLTYDMVYLLDDEDQYDFNKLWGVKKCYFKPTEESMMIAWRFNPMRGAVELMPYQHKNGERILHWEAMQSFDKERSVITSITEEHGEWVVSINGVVHRYVNSGDINRMYRIVHYFGGNKTSPKKIPIKFDFERMPVKFPKLNPGK